MQIKVRKTEFGTIKYRHPNVPETLRLIGKIGFKADGKLESDEESEFGQLAKLMECVGPLVEEVDCELPDGTKVTSYDDLLNYPDFLHDLSFISSEIFESFKGRSEPKKKAATKRKAAKKKAGGRKKKS